MSDKDIVKAYKTITAPKRLKTRVMALSQSSTEKASSKVYGNRLRLALSVCTLAFVLFGVFANINKVDVYVGGRKVDSNSVTVTEQSKQKRYGLANYSFSDNTVVSLDIKCGSKTTVNVSVGELYSDSQTLNSNAVSVSAETEIVWVINKDDYNNDKLLKLKTKTKEYLYKLQIDEKSGVNTLKRIK